MKAQYGEVAVRIDGHVAVLTIDRPPHNHVTVELMRDLADALAHIDVEKNLRVSVLAAAGKSFCAGADLAAPSGIANPSAGPGINALYVEAVRLFEAKKPIVAAVHGAAIGAGLGLALAANFVKIGFHPGFGVTHTLPRLIGEQRAALMCLTGRRIKAEDALAWGLVDEVVPLDALPEAAMALAREIAEAAPLAVQSTRATLRADLAAKVKAQTDHEFEEQTWLRKTKDFAEGVRAVAERRPGNFTAS
jgi:enoyl-CoA hydratase/carnithine racemase